MKNLFEPVTYDDETAGAFCPCGCELEYDREEDALVCSSDYCQEADTPAVGVPTNWRGFSATLEDNLALRFA